MGDRWQDDAACKGHTKRMFVSVFEPLAVKTCQDCPVRLECQEAGAGEDFGVWGGLTVPERRRVHHKRARRAA